MTSIHPSISARIEHTLLKPEANKDSILSLCNEAKTHKFRGVCVYPTWIPTARTSLQGSSVKIITVIGFPHGCATSDSKSYEAKNAIMLGADEIDMVVNLGLVKSEDWQGVEEDIRQVKTACGTVPLKVILETALLSDQEKVKACKAALAAGAEFVKTSTGFAGGGATPADIRLMHSAVEGKLRIKASGGVRSLQDALALIEEGADTLGTSSGVKIIMAPSGAGSSPSPENY